MSESMVLADAGHRCAATVSSTGGMRTYPWASARLPERTWPVLLSGLVPIWVPTTRREKMAPTFSCLLDGSWT